MADAKKLCSLIMINLLLLPVIDLNDFLSHFQKYHVFVLTGSPKSLKINKQVHLLNTLINGSTYYLIKQA